jgi:hypothetical protein
MSARTLSLSLLLGQGQPIIQDYQHFDAQGNAFTASGNKVEGGIFDIIGITSPNLVSDRAFYISFEVFPSKAALVAKITQQPMSFDFRGFQKGQQQSLGGHYGEVIATHQRRRLVESLG